MVEIVVVMAAVVVRVSGAGAVSTQGQNHMELAGLFALVHLSGTMSKLAQDKLRERTGWAGYGSLLMNSPKNDGAGSDANGNVYGGWGGLRALFLNYTMTMTRARPTTGNR